MLYGTIEGKKDDAALLETLGITFEDYNDNEGVFTGVLVPADALEELDKHSDKFQVFIHMPIEEDNGVAYHVKRIDEPIVVNGSDVMVSVSECIADRIEDYYQDDDNVATNVYIRKDGTYLIVIWYKNEDECDVYWIDDDEALIESYNEALSDYNDSTIDEFDLLSNTLDQFSLKS